ncbi:MAG: hypothetical protein AAFV07_04435 [Bacteroidota bacterium]
MTLTQRAWSLTGLLLLTFALSTPSLRAQGCLVFERQLETYFLNYKTDQSIDLRKIETAWEKCARPSDKMKLICFYFRSAHALYDAQLSAVEAYEDASYYYDIAARDFDALLKLDRKEKRFVDLYFSRADELEETLRQEAKRLRYREEDRYYGETKSAPAWRKEIIGANASGSSRGMERQESPLFRKRSYRNGRYVDVRPGSRGNRTLATRGQTSLSRRMAGPAAPQAAEEFGYVGSVGEINLINYLRHSRGTEAAPTDRTEDLFDADAANKRRAAPVEEPLVYTPSEAYIPASLDNAWVMDMDGGQGYYVPWLNAVEGTALRISAGDQSPEAAILAFGEVVAVTTPVQVVRHPAGTYMQVQTENGARGWVRQDNFVESGKLAVVTQNARGYLNAYTRQDRNAVLFTAGELVILEAARQDWVRLVNRNLEKRGWITGLDYLSIDELDLRIGMEMYLANRESSLFTRRARLEAIRNWQGYERSELRPAVEAQIQAATAYHSNR